MLRSHLGYLQVARDSHRARSPASYIPPTSYPRSTPSETWLDGTNIQPHFTGGAVHSPDSKQTCESDESSTLSLSVPGIQSREVAPNLPPTAGIQSGIEIPRAKAVAAVVSPTVLTLRITH